MQCGKDSEKRNGESRGETESERLHAEWGMWEQCPWVLGGQGHPEESSLNAPDLAVRCSRGQESVLVSGHPGSWKRKWGKSDSNFFSEPVEKDDKDGKINFRTKNALVDYLKCQPSPLMPTQHHLQVRLQKFSNMILLSHRQGCKAYPWKSGQAHCILRHRSAGRLSWYQAAFLLTELGSWCSDTKAEPGTQFPSLVILYHACEDYDPDSRSLCCVCTDLLGGPQCHPLT